MISIKTDKEIEIMRNGGKILNDVLFKILDNVKPGITELEIDKIAERLIREKGAEPGFKKVRGYHHSICMSTNDVVVHGIPGSYEFKAGDVVGIDCGVYYKGFHTDMAETNNDKVDKFLETGRKALFAGIEQAREGNRVGHISKAIQDIVEKNGGYSVVRSLIGHGVGRSLHEEPEVPGYLVGSIEKTPLLREGMTIAVEIIYNMGSKQVMMDEDGWTIRTEDGSLGGLFERTIVITKNGPILLTG